MFRMTALVFGALLVCADASTEALAEPGGTAAEELAADLGFKTFACGPKKAHPWGKPHPGCNRPTPPGRADGLPVLFTIHMEATTSRECGEGIDPTVCVDDDRWATNMASLDAMVDALDDAGLKGTFLHQIQWLERLELSETGRAITQKMLDHGHEIGIHHHGWDHADPDGYTNNPDAVGADGFLGTMDDYMDIIHAWQERWNYTLVTVEGTGLTVDCDAQPEWIYRASDDHRNVDAVALDDPTDACGFEDGSGKPAWKVIALPSRPEPTRDFTKVGHTYFGKGAHANVDCLGLYTTQILARTEEIQTAGPAREDAINMVLHPVLDYGVASLTDTYDQFFLDIAAQGGVGMTLRAYMCERADYCE